MAISKLCLWFRHAYGSVEGRSTTLSSCASRNCSGVL